MSVGSKTLPGEAERDIEMGGRQRRSERERRGEGETERQ